MLWTPRRVFDSRTNATLFEGSKRECLDYMSTNVTRRSVGGVWVEKISSGRNKNFHTLDSVYSIQQILQSDQPSQYFQQLRRGGTLKGKYPIIHSMIGLTQPKNHHPEGDVFTHTMNVLDAMALITDDLMLRFCALTHDFGKTLTPKEVLPHHYGHEAAGVPLVEMFCESEGAPDEWKVAACFVTEYHGRFHLIREMKAKKVVDLIAKCNESPIGVKGLAMVGLADARGKGDFTTKHPNYDFFLECKETLSVKEGNEHNVRIKRIEQLEEIKKQHTQSLA